MEYSHFLKELVRPNVDFSTDSASLIKSLEIKLNTDFSGRHLDDLKLFDEYARKVIDKDYKNLALLAVPDIVEPVIALVGEIIIHRFHGEWKTVVSSIDGTREPFVIKKNDDSMQWFDLLSIASYFLKYDESEGEFSIYEIASFIMDFPSDNYMY